MSGTKPHDARKKTEHRSVSLKDLARHLSLSPTTLSLVLNESEGAATIPRETKDRIFEAVQKFNYRPNFVARSLRSQRTYSIGVLLPEFSDGYAALLLSGIEEFLLQSGYMYLVASHRRKPDLIRQYPRMLLERCVEGLIVIDTPYDRELPVPVVCLSGHREVKGVTNIVLNHARAAELALRHIVRLGHRNIAFLKGQAFSADTEVRWEATLAAANSMKVPVRQSLLTQLEGDSPSPETGYIAAQKLLKAGDPFTALISFNDVSAIGAIRAFRDAGLSVPGDISVVGFDDAYAAAYHNPALTTIRQPLRQMGMLAAEVVLKHIKDRLDEDCPTFLQVEPELIVRESTCKAPVLSSVSASPR